MEVLILQTDIKWLDPAANLNSATALIEKAYGEMEYSVDLIVLPEMFATGFCMDAQRCAACSDETLPWMKARAQQYDCAVAGSMAVESGGVYRNRFCFVRPDGTVTYYDKRHLFTYSGEDKAYAPGNQRVIVRWRGFDILLQTCYDLRFPVFARNTGDYQLAIYCASWSESRIGVWDTLLRARAIENAAYVIGANRVGNDPAGYHPGHSVAVDYKGNVIAGAEEGRCGYIKATLSLEGLHRFREKFPVLGDADQFVLA